MSGLEIERKFLVKKKGDTYKRAAFSCSHIQQGYIPSDAATVRVRTSVEERGEEESVERKETAFLTIKGKSTDRGLSRYEFEKEIALDEARQLLELCRGGLIDKHRYLVKSPDGRHVFEVDEFHGDNDGLVMAEVELSSADEPFKKPDFIGDEVTGDPRFYNKHMLKQPFASWRHTIPEEYR